MSTNRTFEHRIGPQMPNIHMRPRYKTSINRISGVLTVEVHLYNRRFPGFRGRVFTEVSKGSHVLYKIASKVFLLKGLPGRVHAVQIRGNVIAIKIDVSEYLVTEFKASEAIDRHDGEIKLIEEYEEAINQKVLDAIVFSGHAVISLPH